MERQTDRQTDRDRHRDTDRDRHRETQTHRDTDRDRTRTTDTERHRHTETQTETELELELENFILQGSRFIQKPVSQLVLAKLLMTKYKITGIIYRHNYRHECVSGILYMRISTQNIACAQRQMHTRIHHSVIHYEHTTRKKAVKHLINSYDYSAGKENKN